MLNRYLSFVPLPFFLLSTSAPTLAGEQSREQNRSRAEQEHTRTRTCPSTHRAPAAAPGGRSRGKVQVLLPLLLDRPVPPSPHFAKKPPLSNNETPPHLCPFSHSPSRKTVCCQSRISAIDLVVSPLNFAIRPVPYQIQIPTRRFARCQTTPFNSTFTLTHLANSNLAEPFPNPSRRQSPGCS
ncbi:hypothetical protein CFIO01_03686 [Colletotrichum fioriniae PJ7]|uniref:Secreted protein n=1 Tax=Colletotrichum fioriniae PJ7 TaxID=1445577 RepID=A0A010RNN1_9PEZI|nr:hypothetical protein CFIO01_03686 [Colletotrichum fioriniae PJ7]